MSTKVHFSITGDFITQHARTLWQERSFAKAFDVLECVIGSAREHHEAVIEGRAQFVGTNTLTYEPDAWTPPKGYPTFKQALTEGSHYPEMQQRREDEATELLTKAAELQARWWSTGEDAGEVEMLINAAARLIGKDEAIELLGHLRADPDIIQKGERYTKPKISTPSLMAMQMRKEGFDPTALPSIDALMHRGSKIKPTLCPDMSSANGWLLPDGKFYGCGGMEHVGLAEQLLQTELETGNESDPEKLAESKGWIKLARSFTGFHCIGQKKATKRQLTKLWDYAQAHGRDYEELIRYVKEPL